ncbi:MAG: pyridoxamine 5'-phosphate oxidase family protein [Nitrosarchaeum sp.]|nr:pyridoxamine 5'-phosphate oxidase family protein [Nitrosarchaeum sp.]MBP0119312.1 pyridoxamine 5'-phosphate oxidase family protein [Nitrosarchaeum sp.]
MIQKLDSQKLESVISDMKIPIRLACITLTGAPIVVSLWYTIFDGKIYCATQKKAKIISYIQNNPVFGFEIATDSPPYRGVRGHGKVKVIEHMGKNILEILIDKYLGKKISTLSEFLRNNSENEVAIEITPEKLFTYDYSKRMKGV